MTATREQAQRGAAKTNERHAARVAERRVQVQGYRLTNPGMSAEDVARALRCSPSTIRGDWRALRTRSLQVTPSTQGAAAVSVEGDEGL